jgi:WD40 repeat protein
VVWNVVFSPDGQLVASLSKDSTVRLWEVATGQCRSVLEGYPSLYFYFEFSPDGQTLHIGESNIALPSDLITKPAILSTRAPSCTTVEDKAVKMGV